MTPHALIAAANRLADVLDQENAALLTMDLTRAAGFLPEKTAAFAALPAVSETVSLGAHPNLAPAARRLDDALAENRRLLERAISAQQRVMGIVACAAAAAGAEQPPYGAARHRTQTARPIAVSTRA